MNTLLVAEAEPLAFGAPSLQTTAEPKTLPPSLVGRAVRITGEITCHQDLFIEGEVDGSMELTDYKLTIGSQAHVKASIRAQNVVVIGRAEGNIEASERVELCSQCNLIGDIKTPRIVIKDGACFKGTIEVTRQPPVGFDLPSRGLLPA